MTGVLAMGILLGAVVTAVLQASGATTVMTVGLVNAGLLTLKQGFGIIMGANIGTTMTAQLIAFKLSDYITILIFIGFLMQLLARKAAQISWPGYAGLRYSDAGHGYDGQSCYASA